MQGSKFLSIVLQFSSNFKTLAYKIKEMLTESLVLGKHLLFTLLLEILSI